MLKLAFRIKVRKWNDFSTKMYFRFQAVPVGTKCQPDLNLLTNYVLVP